MYIFFLMAINLTWFKPNNKDTTTVSGWLSR